MNLAALRAALKALLDESNTIAAAESPTAEQIDRIKAIPGEMAELRSQIEALEAIEAVRGWAGQSAGSQQQPSLAAPGTREPESTADDSPTVRGMTAPEDKPWESFGTFLHAVRVAEVTRGQQIDPRLSTRAASGANESVPSDGGFLVGTDTSAELLRRTYETGQVTSRTRRLPVGANSNGIKINGINETSRADGSRWGGVQVYWTGEADALTASRPKFRQIELTLNKLTGLFYATDEVLEDSTALESVAMQAFTEEFGFKLDDACIRGTGAGAPLGILNSPALVTVEKEGGQAANTILAENIVKMWARAFGRSRQNMVWMINQDIEPQLAELAFGVAPSQQLVYMPPGGLSQSPYATLMGRPVIPIEQAATLGTVGDIILADWSQYVMIEKGGLKTAASIHVRFLNDESVFRFTLRTDGKPLWHAPLTPANGSATQSPFIVLETRS